MRSIAVLGCIAGLVGACRLSGERGLSFGGSGTATGSSGSGSTSSSGSSVSDVIDKATARPKKDFREDAFYTITNTVNGQAYALTFILPEGVNRDTVTTNASKAAVRLEPLAEGDPRQLWQFHDAGINPGNSYTIYTKVSPYEDQLTGIMLVTGVDNLFTPTEKYRSRHNRVTVGYNSNDVSNYWQVVKAGAGFRIKSLYGTPDHLNQPGGDQRSDKWNEPRSLEALVEDGKVILVHGEDADVPGQIWTITHAGY